MKFPKDDEFYDQPRKAAIRRFSATPLRWADGVTPPAVCSYYYSRRHSCGWQR
jgi:hypothetical protein